MKIFFLFGGGRNGHRDDYHTTNDNQPTSDQLQLFTANVEFYGKKKKETKDYML